jgi:Fe-S oxidoreductase
MLILLVVAFGVFGFTLLGRWRLMRAGPWDLQFDQAGERMRRMFKFAIGQWRMPRHRLAGIAHIFIYAGAIIMLLRALILFARGFVSNPHFGYWIFDTGTPLGGLYSLIKDMFVVLVVVGVLVFFYYRVIRYLPRMNLNFEGVLILMILSGLMFSDVLYDGATIARYGEDASGWEPLGSLAAIPIRALPERSIVFWQHLGFWMHVGLILGFMNILPYTKQFHEMTAFFNVYFQPLGPAGRLPNIEDIEGKAEREETLGIRRIDQFGAKAVLDFFSCTECGRCQHQCPANNTGKKLSPKNLTTDLRDFGYKYQWRLGAATNGQGGDVEPAPHRADLVGHVVDPEVIWACTTCRACEQECPVFISYVDKIVNLRRHMVMERGEFPEQLQNVFKGLETVGNVYSFANEERADWAKGLDIPLMADKQGVDYLYWVGCAPSFDDRSRKVARAFAQLMQEAGVDFAILGPEETCTGDAARRAGNEYLFQMYARQNCETLNQYKFKQIVTTCPHCYNTLKHEYRDFGGNYDVVHHTDFLATLLRHGQLKPQHPVVGTVAYHDSCYLGRYNDIYDSPREILRAIPGLKLVEPTETRDRGMCCGAGGAQMWKEEEPGDEKINHRRTRQMLEPLPDTSASCTVATACPFCMTMLRDGLKDLGFEDVQQLDVAEVLLKSVRGETQAAPAETSTADVPAS